MESILDANRVSGKAPCAIVLKYMTAYMLKSLERVNMKWSMNLRATSIHLQRFCYEEVHGAVWSFTVCHANLKGYEDGRCVSCENIAVCSDCVQVYDPDFHDDEDDDIPGFSSEHYPAKRGDAVCLQCGIVSDAGNGRRHLLSGTIRAADAIDALLREGDFSSAKELQRSYFLRWKKAAVDSIFFLDDSRSRRDRRITP